MSGTLYGGISIKLGPPPWSDEELERAAFTNLSEIQNAIQALPGREIHERLESLASALRLFNKTADSILQYVEHFHFEAHNNNLLRRNRRHDRQQLEEKIQEALYIFAACSMTLVDQSRALIAKVDIPGYRERVARDFSENPRHKFIQELRVDMVHVALHEPNWRLTWGKDEKRTTRFILHANQLGRLDNYHPLAKKYVSEHPNGIDVGSTVSKYRIDVNALHVWLREAVEKLAADILADYRRCQRIIRAVGSRNWWRIILSQVLIQGNRDPYDYLGQYLTAEELHEISLLQHRSKEQVDRIVELIDEDGACNAELRELVYRACKVVQEK